jgi:hypothetical protein
MTVQELVDNLKTSHELFVELQYRLDSANIPFCFTGIAVVSLYGYGISTNVVEIAVPSDDLVEKVVDLLNMPKVQDGVTVVRLVGRTFEEQMENSGYYAYCGKDEKFWIKVQGDIIGEPFVHPCGLKIHTKELLLKRLDIYAKEDACILKAVAYIALTLDDEKAEKYEHYWNRL